MYERISDAAKYWTILVAVGMFTLISACQPSHQPERLTPTQIGRMVQECKDNGLSSEIITSWDHIPTDVVCTIPEKEK